MKRTRPISPLRPRLLPAALALACFGLLQGRPAFDRPSRPPSDPDFAASGEGRDEGSGLKAAQETTSQEDKWQALVDRVEDLYRKGRFKTALPAAREALRLAETAFGLEHEKVMTSLNYLATLDEELGRHADAVPLYRRAIAIREKVYGPSRSQEELIHDLLGEAEALLGDGHYHALALPRAREALLLAETSYGPAHPSVAESLKVLAFIYEDQGRFREAESFFRRALAIQEKVLGPDHSEVGFTLGYLADLCQKQKRYAEAEALRRRASAILKKTDVARETLFEWKSEGQK